MNRLVFFIGALILALPLHAQERFIKTNTNTEFGSRIRIHPTTDKGWIIFSLDSIRMTKFSKCGIAEWSKKYHMPKTHFGLTDIIKSKLGGFLYLSRINVGQMDFCLVTRFDDNGNVVWSKRYEDTYYDQYGYSINEDAIGNIVVYANMGHVNTSGFNMLLKLDYFGNIIWTKFYDHGGIWGGAIVTSDGGNLARTGSFFIKTNIDGDVEWTTRIVTPGNHEYFAAVEVSDGYIIPGYNTSNINFCKIDLQGNFTSVGLKTSDFLLVKPPPIRKTQNGTIIGVFSKNGYPTVVEMDKDLNVVRQGSIDFPGVALYGKDICMNSNGEPIVAGIAGNNVFFAKMDGLFHTQCDVDIPAMQLVPDTGGAVVASTGVQTHNLTTVDHSFIVEDIPDSQVTLCTVPLVLDIGNDTTVCKSDEFVLRNNFVGLFDEYRWSTGQTTSYIHVDEPGTYWVTAKQYCEDSTVTDTVVIEVDPAIPFEFGDEILQCEDSVFMLRGPACGNCHYEWNTGSIIDSMEIKSPGDYWLRVTKDNGCASSDSVSVDFVKCECDFYVPNAFTPNSDGVNEKFKPAYYCDISEYDLKIFDRWGKMIYASNDIEEGWNGTYRGENVPHGVYNYTINYNSASMGSKGDFSMKGFVVVLY